MNSCTIKNLPLCTRKTACHIVCLFVCLFFIMKPDNPYFASRFGLEVNPLGVYPLGPRRSPEPL